MFSVKLGRIEAVVVSGHDAVRQVLCNKDDFDGRPDGFFFRFRAFYKRLGKLVDVKPFLFRGARHINSSRSISVIKA